MANVFIHFEPIGKVGDDIVIDPDLPGYIIRGEYCTNSIDRYQSCCSLLHSTFNHIP